MAVRTTAEEPLPVRRVAQLIGQWIARLGWVWVEGQVTQISRRPGTSIVFLTLRDPAAEISLQVTCSRQVYDAVRPPLTDGARVVVHAKPDFYLARGQLSLNAAEIRPVGVGELLARLEHLKRVLAAEGLFAPERKKRLPFLPRLIGLVCGRGSAAERDVLENARRRWPAVRFRVMPVAVQGVHAVPQVIQAVQELDRDPDVDVIIIARGGGSVEDLLPFSDESLVRTVARCVTPVVSAIGHEQDSPILDLVADLRASTPTDAAKKVVPDVREEGMRIEQLRQRAYRCVLHLLDREQSGLDMLRHRPVLAHPHREMIARREAEIEDLRMRLRRCLSHRLDQAYTDLEHARARVLALSPAATLRRGYAIVQRVDGLVVRSAEDVALGEEIQVRLAAGRLTAEVTKQEPASDPGAAAVSTERRR
ncbi:exodeoxyribonuclease VII large subunit [Carbonactinospora thermoautotrophica]|uniref:exodeoxyribonuclease VII large subunit n=2 Tax=Carbonactinospora thermoautotrophica TaxID=1469144 RepID=UPI000836B7A7|nr:exodeoxyribonuclease VII large subunit [Carbonactinospora thermoautotrophica]